MAKKTQKKNLVKKPPARRSRRRVKKNPPKTALGKVMNPPIMKDLAQQVVPAFVAYAASRFISRVAATQVAKKWPKAGKHAGVVGSLATFAGAYFGAHKIEKLKPYHDQIMIGAAISVIQTVVQTYVPKYGWIVSDYTGELKAAPAPNAMDGFLVEPRGSARSYALPGNRDGDDLDDIEDADLGILSYNGDEADLLLDD